MSSEISQCKYVQQGSPFAKRSDPHLAPVARFPRAAVVPVLWRLCERHNCAGSHHLLGSVAATSGVAATGVMAGTPQRNVACARHQRLVTASVQRRLRQAPPSRQRHERAVQVARSSSTRPPGQPAMCIRSKPLASVTSRTRAPRRLDLQHLKPICCQSTDPHPRSTRPSTLLTNF
jgi:hypothetical protein